MPAYTVSTLNTHGSGEPFRVIVENENHRRVAVMDAMSRDHARLVAGALVLLLPKLDPGHSVVLDSWIAGRITAAREIATPAGA